MNRKAAYSYVRFSTPEQAKGFSKDRQDEGFLGLCERKGWSPDTSLNINDLGKSGFKGEQKGLRAFLAAIEQGRVEPGSILVIEKLDRLSRQQIDPAMDLFKKILKAGVWIATTSPERIYTEKSVNNVLDLMEAMFGFYLANEESQKKSDRTIDNWERKRKLSEAKPIGGKAPAWVRWVDGAWELDKPKAKIVKQIFQWAIDGLGSRQICKKLNQEKIPNIALGTRENSKATWNLRYVEQIQVMRQTMGELQNYKMNGKKRVSVGEPIKGYFPAAVSEETFYACQAARKARTKLKGPQGERIANLFQGLCFDAESGSTMRIWNSGQNDKKKGIMRRIAAHHGGDGLCSFKSWGYEEFETNFLTFVREIVVETTPALKMNPLPGFVEKLVDLQAKIAKINDRLINDSGFEELLEVLRRLSDERKSVEQEIEAAKASVERSKATQAEEVLSTLDLLATADDQEAARAKVKSVIRMLISEIWIRIEFIDGNRCAKMLGCQVRLKSGKVREFWIKSWKGELQWIMTIPEPFTPDRHLRDVRPEGIAERLGQLVLMEFGSDEYMKARNWKWIFTQVMNRKSKAAS